MPSEKSPRCILNEQLDATYHCCGLQGREASSRAADRNRNLDISAVTVTAVAQRICGTHRSVSYKDTQSFHLEWSWKIELP